MRYERDLIDEVLVHIPHQRIARARHLERQAAGFGTRQRDMEREMLGHHGDLIWTAADKLTREMHAHVDIVRTSPPPAANLTATNRHRLRIHREPHRDAAGRRTLNA